MKPASDIHQGDRIEVSAALTNSGLADGEANIVLEQVESSGERKQLDVRVVSVGSGQQYVYEFPWKPTRAGSQWLELSIVNGPNSQSKTVLVDQPRSNGVLGTITTVNPALLGIVALLTAGLVGLLIFGLRREDAPASLRPGPQKVAKSVAPIPNPNQGPYGAPTAPASPGEDPYK